MEDVTFHTDEEHHKNLKFVDSERTLHSQRSIDSEDIIGYLEGVTLHTYEERDKNSNCVDSETMLHSQLQLIPKIPLNIMKMQH